MYQPWRLNTTIVRISNRRNTGPQNSFDKAKIYEATDESKNNLPEAVSLLKFAPSPGDQGQQGSCVAWSSAYGARTILESSTTGVNPDQVRFSPSFLYNQIGLDGCQGSYIIRAMETMDAGWRCAFRPVSI